MSNVGHGYYWTRARVSIQNYQNTTRRPYRRFAGSRDGVSGSPGAVASNCASPLPRGKEQVVSELLTQKAGLNYSASIPTSWFSTCHKHSIQLQHQTRNSTTYAHTFHAVAPECHFDTPIFINFTEGPFTMIHVIFQASFSYDIEDFRGMRVARVTPSRFVSIRHE